jgi:homoserine acetyltransferase
LAGDEPTLDAGLAKVKAKLLVMPSQSDLLVYPKYSQEAAEHLKKLEKTVQYSEILVMAVTTSIEDIDTVGDQIKDFLK